MRRAGETAPCTVQHVDGSRPDAAHHVRQARDPEHDRHHARRLLLRERSRRAASQVRHSTRPRLISRTHVRRRAEGRFPGPNAVALRSSPQYKPIPWELIGAAAPPTPRQSSRSRTTRLERPGGDPPGSARSSGCALHEPLPPRAPPRSPSPRRTPWRRHRSRVGSVAGSSTPRGWCSGSPPAPSPSGHRHAG